VLLFGDHIRQAIFGETTGPPCQVIGWVPFAICADALDPQTVKTAAIPNEASHEARRALARQRSVRTIGFELYEIALNERRL